MIKYAIIFLEWAKEFLDNLDDKTRKKVIYNNCLSLSVK